MDMRWCMRMMCKYQILCFLRFSLEAERSAQAYASQCLEDLEDFLCIYLSEVPGASGCKMEGAGLQDRWLQE